MCYNPELILDSREGAIAMLCPPPPENSFWGSKISPKIPLSLRLQSPSNICRLEIEHCAGCNPYIATSIDLLL